MSKKTVRCIGDTMYFIKEPESLTDKSPIYEYLGASICSLFYDNVIDVKQSTSGDRICALHEDFLDLESAFMSFSKIMTSLIPGAGTNLFESTDIRIDSIRNVLRSSYILKTVSWKYYHFWSMFFLDFLISNVMRRNSDWGILYGPEGVRFTPIYDFSRCLRTVSFDPLILKYRDHETIEELEAEECYSSFCHEDGTHINVYEMLKDNTYPIATFVFKHLFAGDSKLKKMKYVIKHTQGLTVEECDFISKFICRRYMHMRSIADSITLTEDVILTEMIKAAGLKNVDELFIKSKEYPDLLKI